jgi:hypothetical protein
VCSRYKADDDDLPDIFFDSAVEFGKQRDSGSVSDRKSVAVQVHFPVINWKNSKQERREKRAIEREQRDNFNDTRKVFVKSAKRQQMFDWLTHLEGTFPGMDERKRDFCEKLLRRFRRYGIQRIKWVTRAQYDWTKWIAERYIWIPKTDS